MHDLERELLYRLLTDDYPTMAERPRVFVGELPPDFPLPLPEGTRVLGSRVRPMPPLPRLPNRENVAQPATVVADSPLDPAAFVRALRQLLGAEQWRDLPHPSLETRGLLPAEPLGSMYLYCAQLALAANVRALDAATVSHVMIEVHPMPHEQFEDFTRHWRREPGLVALRVPSGVHLVATGGGGGGGHWHSAAHLTTDLTPAELLAHFATQLEPEWTPLPRTNTSALHAAAWTREGGSLALVTLEADGKDGYHAALTTVAANGEQ